MKVGHGGREGRAGQEDLRVMQGKEVLESEGPRPQGKEVLDQEVKGDQVRIRRS